MAGRTAAAFACFSIQSASNGLLIDNKQNRIGMLLNNL
jgi:hypothetical protein